VKPLAGSPKTLALEHLVMNRTWLGLGLFSLVACSGEPSDMNPPWFEDVAKEVGIEFTHSIGTKRHYMPEITSSGLGLFDFDGDGDQDVFVCQGGDLVDPLADPMTDRLYRNDGDGTFTDITEGSGIGDPYFSFGPTAGDYDGDGDLDLYVGNVGPNALYRNDGGGKFTNVAQELGCDLDIWTTSTSFLDYDKDGDLDIFACTYLRWSPSIEHDCPSAEGPQGYCGPTRYNAASSDRLLRNDGPEGFYDVTEDIGIQGTVGTSLGVVWGDLDEDGQTEIYVAIDGMENHLWDLDEDGQLVNVAPRDQVALNGRGNAEAGMGVLMADLNEDMHFDLYVAHLRGESNTLYTRRGAQGFRDGTLRAGLSSASMAFTGFGVGAADFDHDGHLDLYLANGRVTYARPFFDDTKPYAEPDQVYRGLGGGQFEEYVLYPTPGAENPGHGGTVPEIYEAGRGAVFTDIDGDLDIDVILNNYDGDLRVLRNVAPKRGSALILDVRERDGLPACGARVEVKYGDQTRLFQVQSTSSFASAVDPSVHVGIGNAKQLDSVKVRWLDGTTDTFGPFDAGAVHPVKRAKD
jgi:enediyne biosynthesis protein E4